MAKADLEVAQAACDEFCAKARLAKEARAATEAKCSSTQVEISKVSLKMEEKIRATIAQATREAEGAFARRVKEAQQLAVEAFR